MKRPHYHIVQVYIPRIVKYEGIVYEILPASDLNHATVYARGPKGKGTLRRVRNPILCRHLIDIAFSKKMEQPHEYLEDTPGSKQLANLSGVAPDVHLSRPEGVVEETQNQGEEA